MDNKKRLCLEDAVTNAEIYAVKVIEEELNRKGIAPNSIERKIIITRTADVLAAHREEVRDMYKKSGLLLQDWIIKMSGIKDLIAFKKMKQMGVKSGVSDLCLPYPKGIYCGLYIEMKYDKGRHQPSQKEFLTDMAAAGHYVATCYTARDAVEVLEKYLNLKRLQTHIHVSDSDTAVTETAERMKEPNNSVWKDGEVKPLKV